MMRFQSVKKMLCRRPLAKMESLRNERNVWMREAYRNYGYTIRVIAVVPTTIVQRAG